MKEVIITSGGTEEPIDSVRSISNFSTGRTGAFLADFFAKKGYDVNLWRSYRAEKPEAEEIKQVEYKTFKDLKVLMETELPMRKKPFLFIHAAAVSDYHIKEIRINEKILIENEKAGKISGNDEISLILSPNIKLLPLVRKLNKKAVVCAFKLTDSLTKKEEVEAVEKLFRKGSADMVVHNDINNVSSSAHFFTFYSKNRHCNAGKTKNEMAEMILDNREIRE